MSLTKSNTRMLEGAIDASNITGVLPVANGGTGSSTPVDSSPSVPDAGAIGAYSFGRPLSTGAIAIGDTSTAFHAWQQNDVGSVIYYNGTSVANGLSSSQTGTWRCMSGCATSADGGFAGLWLRIS